MANGLHRGRTLAVSMADREPFFFGPARRIFESASLEDQQGYDRIIRLLCLDPWIDLPVKIKFDVPPAVVSLYHDTQYWVVYHLPDNVTLNVWMIGKSPDAPKPY